MAKDVTSKTEDSEFVYICTQNWPVHSLRKTCAKSLKTSAQPANNTELTHTPQLNASNNPLPIHSLVHTSSTHDSTCTQSVKDQFSTVSTQSIKTIYLYKERKNK